MIMPYLRFQGSCEEAFALYIRAFGGSVQHLSRYGSIPGIDPAVADKVMHGQLQLAEGGCLSGADALEPVRSGDAVSIQAHLPGEERARAAFAVLAEEGEVLSPLAPNPPPDDSGLSGAVRDKYGFVWVLSAMMG